MSSEATADEIDQVVATIEAMGLSAHPLPGPTRTAIGITGNTQAVGSEKLVGLAGVRDLVRITQPYKLASREMQHHDTIVQVGDATFGPGQFPIIAGPCSVENEQMVMQTAEFLAERGLKLMRGGAYKPRTSPYSFQGMEEAGLKLLAKAREHFGLAIVTEVMDARQADVVEQYADMLQVGARNMQNFTLLKRLGESGKPVLLKRGLSATLSDLLMSAEYILAGGNKNVVLCERGVRTFADHTRNTLDLSIIPPLKETSHLPVIADPSHGTGHRAYVAPMAMASLAAGADGLMIEIHPQPDAALSDGAQSLTFSQFGELLEQLKASAEMFGRSLSMVT